MYKFVIGLCAFMMLTACGNTSKKGGQTQVESNKVVEYNYCMFTETPTIHAEIRGNEVLLQFNRKEVEQICLGDNEAYCLPETPVMVENLKGVPQHVFIADVGQDFNPILCVLLENGDVQILSLFGTVRYCDLEASDVVLHGITSFREGGGGAWEDEDGETYYEYNTIYAVSGDKEQEIPLCLNSDCLQYAEPVEGSVAICQLRLTQDWKIGYVLGWEESEIAMAMYGNLWPINEDFDKMVFRYGYELKQQMDFDDEEEDVKVTEVSQKGVFELRYSESQGYTITPIEGLDFAGKGMNVPVEYKVIFD